MRKIDDILNAAIEIRASDVHITVGRPPVFRIHGSLSDRNQSILTVDEVWTLIQEILGGQPHHMERLKTNGQVDFSYSIGGSGRFRVNAYQQRGAYAMAIRLIPHIIPSMEELGLPPVVAQLARKENGLVLITGPTGSGKSTTLASMIELINNERSCHVITLEDPIEYLFRHRRAMVNQREIGSDSISFGQALRSALRQDPDVLMVGEMRDLETISTAITAAETGHLVLASLHSSSAAQTVDRIVDVFPPHQQRQISTQLASTLQGVVSQQLIPHKDGRGRVLAVEIMVANGAVRNLIREGKTHQLDLPIQTGNQLGMLSMDRSLKSLYQKGLIALEEVEKRAKQLEEVFR